MHLQTISLYGFKSFAQDTRVVFSPGITVIVGPNGGGKSNVIDGLRWALGEQRVKELRAERWEDLLHVGSRGQRAKLAEVVLTFDNHDSEMADWPESVAVTRRYYLSGDSEYLLNSRPCRLKDIVDLFLDSGVGRFNYAVIGQGRVDEALLMKPRERLEQLEEAAGVSRYKVRRKETLQHLADVQTNLSRLADLMDDVRQQQESVKAEAMREQQYLTLHKEHAELSVRYQQTQYARALEDRKEWLGAIQSISRQRDLLQQEAARAGDERRRAEQMREEQGRQVAERAQEIRQLEQVLASHDAQIARLEAEWGGYQHELQGLQGQALLVAEQLSAVDSENTVKAAEPSASDNDLASARKAEQDLAHIMNERGADRERAQVLRDQQQDRLQRSERQLARLEGALQAQDAEQLATRLQALDEERAALREEAEEGARLLGAVTQQLAQSEKQHSQHEVEIRQLQSEGWELEARIKALKKVEQEQVSLPSAVRAVLRAAQGGGLSGVLGTLGSLLEVKDGYVMALDVALGGQSHDLVTDTEVHAREVVDWLKAQKSGRVTLLPLDQIRPSTVAERDKALAHLPGAEGWAMDMTEFDPAVFPAVSHVLGRVLVLNSLEAANRIGRQHQFRYKMVTVDGQVVLAGGAISGGSERRQNASGAERAGPLAERLALVRRRAAQLEPVRDEASRELARLRAESDTLRTGQARTRQRAEHIESIFAGLPGTGVADIRTLTQEAAVARQELQTAQIRLQESEALWEESSRQVNQARQRVQRLQEQEDSARHQRDLYARYQAEKLRIRQQGGAVRLRIGELEAAMEKAGHTLEQARADHAVSQSLLAEKSRALAQRQAEYGELEQTASRLGARLAGMDGEERKMSQRLAYLEQQVAKHDARWESYDAPGGEPLAPEAFEEAKNRMAALQQAMDRVGAVKPGVFALYTQLGERLRYLDSEHQDVQLAKDEVQATLEQIDRDVNGRLDETARHVEKAFQEACSALLGGEGGFRWTGGEERGVELWIKPPGKKPSSMSLLSGGEKALGGIAWLFALLAVRPSPFVVLDEVEAALDEANARKVARYIQDHHGTTQYVIVTHHKSTMVIADGLWGVASDGQGQSRLVSVRLEQDAAAAQG